MSAEILPPQAILLVDGKLVLWQALPTCMGPRDTPQSVLTDCIADLADNGRTVERVRWL